MTEKRISIQRYAMTFGTYMGVYWILKFLFLPSGFTNQLFMYLFFGLTFAVPFVGYRFARNYRDRFCNGSLSFLQAWVFLVFMYMFAALLTAVAHYIYFRFFDNGFIFNQITAALDAMPTNVAGMEALLEQYHELLNYARTLSPIEMTMQLLSSNFLNCSIISLITAPFVMRRTSVS